MPNCGASARPVVQTEERATQRHLGERLDHDLVDVAPSPVLTGLIRSHNRVVGLAEMLGRVLILG